MRKFLLACLTLALITTGCSSKTPHSESKGEESPAQGKVLRLNLNDDPTSLDPRKARDLASNTLCSLLFEGLTRIGPDGRPELAIAKEIHSSEDRLLHTIELNETYWSNGDPVTAFDFVYTWRSMLDPLFPAPQADKLYVIKNAKAIRQGLASPDQLGVKALGDYSLSIELEHPVPYLTELLAFRAFLPINSSVDRRHPQWATRIDNGQFAANGPFRITEWRHHDEMIMRKNEKYHLADQVRLDGVRFVMVSSETAFQMWEQGELDWAGSPLDQIPSDSIPSLKEKSQLLGQPAFATELYRFNTTALPFSNEKIRRAFAMAIDRKAIVRHLLQGEGRPAVGFIPPSDTWAEQKVIEEGKLQAARKLFEQGLKELGLTRKTLPPIEITYANSERKHVVAQAVQQDWKKAFNVTVQLNAQEAKVLWDKLSTLNYQVCAGSWFADIHDPVDFLNMFRTKEMGTNNTGWEDPVYQGLLAMSEHKSNPKERLEVLRLAEKLLLEEMPLLPLFHYSLNYVKSDEVEELTISNLGVLQLSHAELR